MHMRPIQWHLKANWLIPESLEKVYRLSKVLSQAPTVMDTRRQHPS